MTPDLGARLKRAREARGVSLRELATRTKISIGSLESMERNDFSRLPGGIFGRSFMRSYASEVGLDPDEIVGSFVAELERREREAAARVAALPEITPDDRRFLERQRRAVLALRVAVVVLIVVLLALLAWQIPRFFGGDESTEEDSSARRGAAVQQATFLPAASRFGRPRRRLP
jgi:cytoskeleton protein RodZ